MASVWFECFDGAGIPLKAAVAEIAMGLVKEEEFIITIY